MFNQINARKLGEKDLNVFEGFFNNPLFIVITIFTIGIQMALVEYGGNFVQCYPLSLEQNCYCIFVGLLEIPFGLLLKFIPVKFFQWVSLDDKPMTEEEHAKSMRSLVRQKSSVMRKHSRVGDDKYKKI